MPMSLFGLGNKYTFLLVIVIVLLMAYDWDGSETKKRWNYATSCSIAHNSLADLMPTLREINIKIKDSTPIDYSVLQKERIDLSLKGAAKRFSKCTFDLSVNEIKSELCDEIHLVLLMLSSETSLMLEHKTTEGLYSETFSKLAASTQSLTNKDMSRVSRDLSDC